MCTTAPPPAPGRQLPPRTTARRRCTPHTTPSLCRSPGRYPGPTPQCFGGPLVRPVGVTPRARIGNLELIGHSRRDEFEGVAAHVDIGDRLFDLRHVAGDAFTAGTSFGVVRVIFDGCRMRSIR